MKAIVENKTEKAWRDRESALDVAESQLSRVEASARIIECVFLDAKRLNRNTWFCNLKRRAAANALSARKEWQLLWAEVLRLKRVISQLNTEIKHYETKLQKTKEYNERRRKRRAEKKQVRQ